MVKKIIDFLLKNEKYDELSLDSSLIMLDLNLPILDGYDILKILKTNKKTKKIPIIVLTTTERPEEIKRCYELGANIYLTKPIDYKKFIESIKTLGLFFKILKIPN